MIDIISSLVAVAIMAIFGIAVFTAEQCEAEVPKSIYWLFFFFAFADVVVQLATNVANYIK